MEFPLIEELQEDPVMNICFGVLLQEKMKWLKCI